MSDEAVEVHGIRQFIDTAWTPEDVVTKTLPRVWAEFVAGTPDGTTPTRIEVEFDVDTGIFDIRAHMVYIGGTSPVPNGETE